MELRCTTCTTSFYSSDTAQVGRACAVPGCSGRLARIAPHLTLVKK